MGVNRKDKHYLYGGIKLIGYSFLFAGYGLRKLFLTA
jgi:hypothetical protein